MSCQQFGECVTWVLWDLSWHTLDAVYQRRGVCIWFLPLSWVVPGLGIVTAYDPGGVQRADYAVPWYPMSYWVVLSAEDIDAWGSTQQERVGMIKIRLVWGRTRRLRSSFSTHSYVQLIYRAPKSWITTLCGSQTLMFVIAGYLILFASCAMTMRAFDYRLYSSDCNGWSVAAFRKHAQLQQILCSNTRCDICWFDDYTYQTSSWYVLTKIAR